MEYLLKSSAIISLFYICYRLFLERDTFYEKNRWFLLLGAFTAFLLPLVVIPIYIESEPLDLSGFVFNTKPSTEVTEKPFNILDYMPVIYGLGVAFFTIRFLVQFASLLSVILNNKSDKIGIYKIIKTNKPVSAFSFFNWIVYNPKPFNATEINQIITHEKIHANQKHSLDVLLIHLSCIVLWFNPFIWFYSKILKQNLEFIADKETAKQTACKKSYQYTLLKTSIPKHQMALSNNFYNSLIKKRIVMLHKSKSKNINQLKYAFIVPVLGLFLMSFNTVDVYVEKPKTIRTITEQTEQPLYFVDGKETSKDDFDNIVPETIASVNILKGDAAIAKYGEKGRNGVVEIVTKVNDLISNTLTKPTMARESTESTSNDTHLNNWKITIGTNTVTHPEIDTLKWKAAKKPIGLNWVSEENKKISLYNKNGTNHKDLLYFIDGKEAKKTELDAISPDNIESINVINDNIAVSKYGEKAKNGVIEVITKKVNPWGITMTVNEKEDILKTEHLGENPLYVLNGEKITKAEFKKINRNDIAFVSGSMDKKYNLKKYGDDREDGVFEITTKSHSTHSVKNAEATLKETLIIKDGKVLSHEEFNNLNFQNLSINVLTKKDAAFKKYESYGKNEVWEIITNKTYKIEMENGNPVNKAATKGNTTTYDGNAIINVKKNDAILVMIDGKKKTLKDAESIAPEKIESINVLKGEDAIKKYGDKGNNGVIEITTKK